MRNLLSILRKVTLAVALGAVAGLMALSPAAEAASALERSIWLSGPRYDGDMGQCGEALGTISSQFAEKREQVLEFQP